MTFLVRAIRKLCTRRSLRLSKLRSTQLPLVRAERNFATEKLIRCLNTFLFRVEDQRVELAEHHSVRVRYVAACAGVLRQRSRSLFIRRRVMTEIKEPPSIRCRETLAVLDRNIDAGQRSWKIAAA